MPSTTRGALLRAQRLRPGARPTGSFSPDRRMKRTCGRAWTPPPHNRDGVSSAWTSHEAADRLHRDDDEAPSGECEAPSAGMHDPAEDCRLHASRTFDGWLRLDGLFAPDDADLVDAALGAGRRPGAAGRPTTATPASKARPVSALRAGALVDLAAQSMRQEPSDASVARPLPRRRRSSEPANRRNRPKRPATPPPTGWCWAPRVRSSTSAGRPTAGRPPSAGRSPSATGAACSRAATGRHHGPTSTTAPPGRDGGATSVDNGALLCRRHHTFVHRQHWQITIDDGRPTTRRPDGTPHTIQRWQHPDQSAA